LLKRPDAVDFSSPWSSPFASVVLDPVGLFAL
jgi:hypothetical protein